MLMILHTLLLSLSKATCGTSLEHDLVAIAVKHKETHMKLSSTYQRRVLDMILLPSWQNTSLQRGFSCAEVGYSPA